MSQYESFHIWGEGRFCYDDELVNKSKELIKEAEKTLDDTKENLAKGFSSLLAAANIDRSTDLAENIRVNEPVIENFPEECVSYMEELYRMVKSKQEEIEEYKNANGFKKFGMTVAMGTSKLVEGIASVGENIVDAGATLVGCVGGIFNSDFQDSCAKFIKKDHVGDAFHNFNEATGINKYSVMSENGTMAKLFKGVGVATGYVLVGMATGGALGVTATTANTVTAVVGGLGSGMESGLKQGKDWNSSLGQGVKQAAIQGATAYAMGKFAEKAQTSRAMRAQDGAHEEIISNAAENVKASKQAVAKARAEYAKAKLGTTESTKAKMALKEAKEGLKSARATQQFLEKESIAGTLGKQLPAPKQTASTIEEAATNLATNAGEKTTSGVGTKIAGKVENVVDKVGSAADKVGDKIEKTKLYKGLEKTRSITMNVGTKAEHLTNKLIDNPLGNAVAGKVGTVIDKVDDVSAAVASKASKIPGVQTLATKATNFAQNHKVITTVAKLPVEVASTTVKTAATGLAKSPGISMDISNEMQKMDSKAVYQVEEQREHLDKVAQNTIAKDDISYDGILTDSDVDYGTSNQTPSVTDNHATNLDTSYTPNNSSSSNYSSYQPSVAARHVSSSGDGYTAVSSGNVNTNGNSGTSYTATHNADSTPLPKNDNVSPIDNISPSNGNNNINNGNTSKPITNDPSSTNPGASTNPVTDPINNNEKTPNIPSNENTPNFPNTPNNENSTPGPNIYEEPAKSQTSYGSSGTEHSGGGYSSDGYSFSGSEENATSIDPTNLITEDATATSGGRLASSITSTNKFSNQTIKIPTSSEPLSSSSNNNIAIPTAAAFSAAAATGIGAKAFLDQKHNKENNEDVFTEGEENSGIYTENWNGTDDDIKVDYGTEDEETLDDEDSYSADSIIEKYEAVSKSELEEA